MLKSSLCYYGDAYILVKWTITIVEQGTTTQARQDERKYKKKQYLKILHRLLTV